MIQLKPKLHFIRLRNPRRFWGLRPLGPQQGFAWTHWGCHSCPQTSCWKRCPPKNSGYVTASSSSFSFHSFFPFSICSFRNSILLFISISVTIAMSLAPPNYLYSFSRSVSLLSLSVCINLLQHFSILEYAALMCCCLI